MKKEIGGEFHLPLSFLFREQVNQFDKFITNGPKCFLTSSGRDSLKLIIKILGLSHTDEVLLPAYLCQEMLIPFQEERVNFAFYKVNCNLVADIDDIKVKISGNTKALLVIHYFGYRQPVEEIRKSFKEHSIYLIEDTAQSFLTKYNGQFLGRSGDLAFTSFRKFLPVLDGSLLVINRGGPRNDFEWRTPSLRHFSYLCLRYLGMKSKNLYLKTHLVPKPVFLYIFRAADKMLNKYPKPAKMSSLSKRVLYTFDFDDIILKRRRNFQHLLDNWRSDIIQPVFRELPADVCPLGFPVFSKDRDYVKHNLIERRIYPPVHWNLPLDISKEEFGLSWEISRHILTIPIDQRYELSEMDYILKQIHEIDMSLSKTTKGNRANCL
jgi:dTDP-4-amino-4,6-dideoxygalactose transaminase